MLIVLGEPLTAREARATAAAGAPQLADIRIEHDILADDQPVLWIFYDVLRGTGLHGGFVEVARCSDLVKGRLQIKQGATLGQAMDALVAANPGYRWELNDGVVNLMSQDAAPLLRTKIAKLQINTTDREVPSALGDLLRLPEVREREAALGLKLRMGGVGLGVVEKHPVPRQPLPVHINVQNLSLGEAFNKIVAASPKSVWMYQENDCNGPKTYTVEVSSSY
jgi:hypothetical protein